MIAQLAKCEFLFVLRNFIRNTVLKFLEPSSSSITSLSKGYMKQVVNFQLPLPFVAYNLWLVFACVNRLLSMLFYTTESSNRFPPHQARAGEVLFFFFYHHQERRIEIFWQEQFRPFGVRAHAISTSGF
ncbi:hypothetical protein ACFFRR_005477 [Megaselia abdita]